MKNYQISKLKVLGVSAFILAIASAALYFHQIQLENEKAAETKLAIGRKEASERFREGARLLAEQQRLNPIVIQKDPLAPEEKTDVDELAQIKLWNKTPPKERHKLQTN